jgi:NAD(P)-dependent dehydrogenase (short-subunit alcohol dehydrogenase family)
LWRSTCAADLDRTASLVTEAGGRVHTEIVDVRDLAGVQAAADRGVQRFGGLDVVCATAGITSRGMAVDLGENAWCTLLDVNLTGVWHTCRAGAPHLIARGAGAMILTNSIAGLRGLVGVAHYTAAKHGVLGLMRSLANELAPHMLGVPWVDAVDVANATLFLASDEARYITAVTLPVDAGATQRWGGRL